LFRLAVFPICLTVLTAAAMPDVMTVQLQPRTVEAFDAYKRAADTRFEQQLKDGPFLWVDAVPDRKRQVLSGKILAEPQGGQGDRDVPDGLIHDWTGAVFIPGTTLAKTLAFVEDYDRHAEVYKPELLRSRLVSREDNTFHIYQRLLKKQILTVVLDAEHEVQYTKIADDRWYSRSHTTRIAEVQNPGAKDERSLPPGRDHGFLWRLDTYWKFAERDGGVYVECEAISLTRDVPTGLGWIVNPIVRSLPRESLTNTMRETKAALSSKPF
jgi:hypothetical protein